MMLLLITFALFLTISSGEKQVPCEIIYKAKRCLMKVSTTIDDPSTRISTPKNEFVKEIDFSENKKILFLPIEVVAQFPNLTAFIGDKCSIKELKKEIFQNFKDLQYISLRGNQIERIYEDSFAGSFSLNTIDLRMKVNVFFIIICNNFISRTGSNRIKQIDAEVFEGLNNLEKVWLTDNICTNQAFHDQTQIQMIPLIMSKKCRLNKFSVS